MRTVLVHGLAGSSRWWRDVERRLEGLDLEAVDLPSRQTLEELEEWLAARLEPSAALVGHSLGGYLAARVAARRPELVERLVLIAPAGGGGRSLVGHAFPLARTLTQIRPGFAPRLVHGALRAGPLGLWTGVRAALTADLRAELAAVRAPTLVMWGEHERLVPVVEADRVAVVPRAGHVPMVDRPDEVSRLLREFLLDG